jgi:hypothetical protein
MCIGPCIVVINDDEEPTRCYVVFYYTYERLNMFRAELCTSSGAHGYISDYHMDRLILRLLMVCGYVQVGWLSVWDEGYCSPYYRSPENDENVQKWSKIVGPYIPYGLFQNEG